MSEAAKMPRAELFPDLDLNDEFRKGMTFAATVANEEIKRLRAVERELLRENARLRVAMRAARDLLLDGLEGDQP